nr:helix-turn-helix domain-containing protein [Pedobacter panaciterrae]
MKDIIPVHKLYDRSPAGMEVLYFESVKKSASLLGAHRDDHYIFIFQEKGESNFMLDFKSLLVSGCAILYVMPGQVHHSVDSKDASGWFLAIDPILVTEEYRTIFEHHIINNGPLSLDDVKTEKFRQCVKLLYERFMLIEEPLGRSITHSLAQSYIGMIAGAYLSETQFGQKQNTRPVQINSQFRSLLLTSYKTIKSPSEYAEKLNISLTYLNEVVKGLTGFPVSYWIHNEIILEAKRLLYYSDLTVKEIAFELGFSDHTYFSRLFTKFAGNSAGAFRAEYRK